MDEDIKTRKALEQTVKDNGMWDVYVEFEKMMTETAMLKFPTADGEQREQFVKTCKYSFAAGVTETIRKFTIDAN
jgi:hypothetical protein